MCHCDPAGKCPKGTRAQPSTELHFVKFKEYNDNEGETWYFFLQVEGNGERLVELQDLIETLCPPDEDPWFTLDTDQWYPESEVDILVKHSPGGYMDTFQKITGKLQPIDREKLVSDYEGELTLDGLYKGGVRYLFEE